MEKNYYFPGVQVMLIDSGDVYTMISLYNKSIRNIQRYVGADMLVENENRVVDDSEMNKILSTAGITLS